MVHVELVASCLESNAEVSTSLLTIESVMEDVESFPELSKTLEEESVSVCDHSFIMCW